RARPCRPRRQGCRRRARKGGHGHASPPVLPMRWGVNRGYTPRPRVQRRVVFFAVVFLAVVFRAGAFLAVAPFFPGARLAAVFCAGACLAGRLPVSTASLKAFNGVTRTRRDALMRIASPVCGLRPIRAARSTRANLAKPLIATTSPDATVSVT